ncbi:MAG: GNAT family N-acetyltransferase [Mucilaginibacter sp.]|nr:GNAT family N-acetyltransferase [Mucilaginibacter sp.]
MTAIEQDTHRIDPLGAADVRQYEQLAQEIFQLLSDEHTLQFLPEKKLSSLSAAKNWLSAAILNFHSGRNQVHLIRSQVNGKLLGIIDVIPPVVAQEHYQLSRYPYFVEFYLNGNARGQALMSRLLPKVVSRLQGEGIEELAAVVHRLNVPAAKVLKRAGFKLAGAFDPVQDIYQF